MKPYLGTGLHQSENGGGRGWGRLPSGGGRAWIASGSPRGLPAAMREGGAWGEGGTILVKFCLTIMALCAEGRHPIQVGTLEGE